MSEKIKGATLATLRGLSGVPNDNGMTRFKQQDSTSKSKVNTYYHNVTSCCAYVGRKRFRGRLISPHTALCIKDIIYTYDNYNNNCKYTHATGTLNYQRNNTKQDLIGFQGV